MADKLTQYLTNKNLIPFASLKAEDNIRAMAKFLCGNGEAVEIRLFQLPSLQPFNYKNGGIGYKNTYSVYANSEEDFIKLANALESIAEKRKILADDPQPNKQSTVCFSLQVIREETAKERIEQTKKEGIEELRKLYRGEFNNLRNIKQCSARDIVKRRFLVIDLDPERESGTPSTEAEKDKARELAIEVLEFLKWDIPLIVDSGNGIHLIFCVNLEENQETRKLIDNFYSALSSKLSNEFVKIDSSLGDSSRCLKLAGTKNRKGINPTEERPHRLSHIIYMPGIKKPIPMDEIKKIAELAPKKEYSSDTDYQEYTPKTLPPTGSILFKRNRFKAIEELNKRIGVVADGQGRFEKMKQATSIAVSYLGKTPEALKVVLEWNSRNRPPKDEKSISDYFNNFIMQRYDACPIGIKADTFIADWERIKIEPYKAVDLYFGGYEVKSDIANFLGIRRTDNGYFIPCYDIKGNIAYIRNFDLSMKVTGTQKGSNNIAVFNGLKSICIICCDELTAYRIFKEEPRLTILVLADCERRIDRKTYSYIRNCRKVFVCFIDLDQDKDRGKIEALNDFYLFLDGAIAIKERNIKAVIEANTSKDDFVTAEIINIEPPKVEPREEDKDTSIKNNSELTPINCVLRRFTPLIADEQRQVLSDKEIQEVLNKAVLMIDTDRISKATNEKLKEFINRADESKPIEFSRIIEQIKELIEPPKEIKQAMLF